MHVILHHFNQIILGWKGHFSLYLFVLSSTKSHPSFRNSQPSTLHMQDFPALVEESPVKSMNQVLFLLAVMEVLSNFRDGVD